jgi:hypothetical protein
MCDIQDAVFTLYMDVFEVKWRAGRGEKDRRTSMSMVEMPSGITLLMGMMKR